MNYINKLKIDTNNNKDIIYREYKINKTIINIIYYEPLVSSTKISDFIIRSLTSIKYKKDIYESIKNNISNFKYKELKDYNDLVKYLNLGYTIILVNNKILGLETKGDLKRSISTPEAELALRGSKDAFIEEYQTNMGLIKKRLRTNNLWVKEIIKGEYSNTKIGILYLKDKVDNKKIEYIYNKINTIKKNVISSDDVKKVFNKKNYLFPNIKTSERPDIISKALLGGKIVILVDNNPFLLILPIRFNDLFKTMEDVYSNRVNESISRIFKYIAFWFAVSIPGIYIALINYNLEIIPDNLLVNFAIQRNEVPFPVFFEALVMMLGFDLLRESDLRTPSFTGNSLSIVGALILGEAAVNAGVVSPIMIIVIALTAICSLPFNELELTNSIRVYRLFFILCGTLLGITGITIAIIFMIINLSSIDFLDEEYIGGL